MHCNVERLCWAEVFKSICCPGICCLLGRVERGVEGVLDIEESAPQKAQKEQHYLSGGSWRRIEVIREAPFNESPPLFGHCPFGGGGLNPCPDGLGHFFREEFSKFKGAFA